MEQERKQFNNITNMYAFKLSYGETCLVVLRETVNMFPKPCFLRFLEICPPLCTIFLLISLLGLKKKNPIHHVFAHNTTITTTSKNKYYSHLYSTICPEPY